MEWSLLLREAGWRLLQPYADLPVEQERHRGYHDSDPAYRDQQSRAHVRPPAQALPRTRRPACARAPRLGRVRTLPSADLAALTTLGVGGPALRVDAAESAEEVVDRVRAADAAHEPLLLIGGGSQPAGRRRGLRRRLPSLVDSRGIAVRRDCGQVDVTAQAGEPWDALVERCVAEGLAGVEALSGIPGRVGATPIQNVGAYGQEVADTLVAVRVWDRTRGEVVELAAADCGFGYRSSRFKAEPGRWAVLEAVFRLEPARESRPVRYAELARALGVGLGDRAPLSECATRCCGCGAARGWCWTRPTPTPARPGRSSPTRSWTRRPPTRLPADAPRFSSAEGVKTSAAWLIEQAGFGRGWGAELTGGRAALSTKHVLALTNRGGASAADLLTLARAVRDGVVERFGVRLEPEPVLVGCAL